MAPSIPTHRPLVTATRLTASVAIVASASSLYLAFGGTAWAGGPADRAGAAATCVATAGRASGQTQVGLQAPERGAE